MISLRNVHTRLAAIAAGTLVSASAFAQDFLGSVPTIGNTGTGNAETDIRMAILSVLQTVLNFMALIAVIFIVIAGIRLVISQGDEGEKDKAKKTIIYVIIGLVIIIFASTIVGFISSTLANA